VKGACHCGQVTITVPGRPDYLNQCNCTFCAKLGGLWGYYPDSAVEVTGATRAYSRTDQERPTIAAHFCPTCGATIRWAPLPELGSDRTGINMRLFEPAELAGVEVRYGDRRAHPHVEPRRYYHPPTTYGEGCPTI